MSLPFEDTDVKLPDNRNQAVRRINQLKRRFQKLSKLLEDCKRNMKELLENEYAKNQR